MKSILNERYADALVRIAFKNESIQDYAEKLEMICLVLEKDSRIGKSFADPRISTDIKIMLAIDLFSKDIDDEMFMNFIKILAEQGRIKQLPGILREYLVIAKDYYEMLTITIETPMELSEKQIDEIKEKCIRRFGVRKIRERVILNEELIGGMKIIAGNVVIDNSLKKQLDDIEKLMNE